MRALTRRMVLCAGVAGVLFPAVPVPLRAASDPPGQAFLERTAAETLPSFTLPELGGRDVALSAQAGRVVLVHFFATWCEPCREELPALSRLAADHPQDVTILAVDVGEVDLRVRRFFEGLPVPFTVALDRDRAVTRQWGISALPSTVILDRALRPRWRAAGDVAWDAPAARAVIAELLSSSSNPVPGAAAPEPSPSSGGLTQ